MTRNVHPPGGQDSFGTDRLPESPAGAMTITPLHGRPHIHPSPRREKHPWGSAPKATGEMLTLQADACYPPEGILKDPEELGGCCTFGHIPGRLLHAAGRVLHILTFF